MANLSNTSNLTHWGQRYTFLEFKEKFSSETVTIGRTISPIWYAIGILCNLVVARIWLDARIRRNTSSAVYLGALSISDWIFLLLHLVTELHYAWGLDTFNMPTMCEIFLTIYMIPQYCAPLFVLGFTIERYIAVCYPFQKETWCTPQRALIAVCALLSVSVSLSLVQSYLWTYSAAENICNVRPHLQTGGGMIFYTAWTWISDVGLFVVVPFLVLLFNIRVIVEIRRLTTGGPAAAASQSDSKASTITLLCVSFYLIFTLLPATVFYCCQGYFPMGDPFLPDDEIVNDELWSSYFSYSLAGAIINEWSMSRSACNFFIYFFTGEHFRLCFYRLFPFLDKLCGKGSTSRDAYHSVNTNGCTVATKV